MIMPTMMASKVKLVRTTAAAMYTFSFSSEFSDTSSRVALSATESFRGTNSTISLAGTDGEFVKRYNKAYMYNYTLLGLVTAID